MAKRRTREQIFEAARASREHAAQETENESIRSSDMSPLKKVRPQSSLPLRLEPADRACPVIQGAIILIMLTLATLALSVPVWAMYWLTGSM
jgi:hypothetical protein